MKKALLCAAVVCLIAAGVAAAAIKAGQIFQADVNDTVFVKDSKIMCSVARTSGVKFLTCYKLKDPTHLAIGSYAIAISDTRVSVIKVVDAKKRKVVFQHKN